MIHALIAIALAPTTLTLSRGAEIPGHVMRYWEAEETVLDRAAPNQSFGGEYTLTTGGDRIVLVRFGGLDRALKGYEVKSARLLFEYAGPAAPKLVHAYRCLAAWGKGPLATLNTFRQRPAGAAAPEEPKKPKAPEGSATWNEREAGIAEWAGGSPSEELKEVSDASLRVSGPGELSVEGIGSEIEDMRKRPAENRGFAFRFEGSADLTSSLAAEGKPRLEVEVAPVEDSGKGIRVRRVYRTAQGWSAEIENTGDSPAAIDPQWSVEGAPFQPKSSLTIPAHGRAEATLGDGVRFRGDSTRFHRIQCEAQGSEMSAWQGAPNLVVSYQPGFAKSEAWIIDAVREFNEAVLPQSRFSFAPDGATNRVNLGQVLQENGPIETEPQGVRLSLGANGVESSFAPPALEALENALKGYFNRLLGKKTESLDRFPGLSGYGDTRSENTLVYALSPDYEGVFNPVLGGLPLEATDLLSGSETAQINGVPLAYPKTVVIKALDFGQQPIPGAKLDFFRGGAQPEFTLNTDAGGVAILPQGPFAGAKGLDEAYEVRLNGISTRLPAWRLYDAANRGASEAALIDLHFNVPGGPVDPTIDLAKRRIVTDSGDQLPAILGRLTDEANAQPVALAPQKGAWLEIDLGRDRAVAEVELTVARSGKLWPAFDLTAYSTGQTSGESYVWAKEIDSRYALRSRGVRLPDGSTRMVYHGIPQRFRFLRLVSAEAGEAELVRVVVHPVHVDEPK